MLWLYEYNGEQSEALQLTIEVASARNRAFSN
jgi:hypothetical protein